MMTVIADSFDGKPLNSPNDLVPHPDGSIWTTTDPPYGGTLSKGQSGREPAAPPIRKGLLNPADRRRERRRHRRVSGDCRHRAYRWDPSGKLDVVLTEDQVPDPNGICFSPDHKTPCVISTGKGPGDAGAGGKGIVHAFRRAQGNRLSGQRLFTDMMVDGVHCGPDGMRADVFGNMWISSNTVLGYAGVLVFNAQRQADRPHPPAGGVCQSRVRRAKAQHAGHVFASQSL